MADDTITQTIEGKFKWINVSKIDQETIRSLGNEYRFHDFHINDCLSPIQRPKFDALTDRDYFFMALIFPVWKHKKRVVESAEIDFFIGKDYLITISDGEYAPFINFFNECASDEQKQKIYMQETPAHLLYALLRSLISSCAPIIEELNYDIKNIEENMFRGFEHHLVKEILAAKRNSIDFSRVMIVHKSVMREFIRKGGDVFPRAYLDVYFEDIVEQLKTIWDMLHTMAETLTTLESTNNSTISFKLNSTMKILTTLSAIFLPVNLVAFLFATTAVNKPIVGHSYDFWIIVGIAIIAAACMIIVAKIKKWL